MLDTVIQAICDHLGPVTYWALHFHPYATVNALAVANGLLLGLTVYRVTRRSEVQ